MKIKTNIALLLLIFTFLSCKENGSVSGNVSSNLTFAFYNVENLLDTKDDPKKADNEFLPDARYKWTEEKYHQKLKNIAQVIEDINADAIGFAEVENKQVLKDLLTYISTRKYEIVHSESYDIRGIDQGLFYDPTSLELIKQEDITARMPDGKYAGPRNILKASFLSGGKELDIYVNHWPSRRGGKEQKRIAFSNQLSTELKKDKSAFILMGDFNDTPSNTSIRNLKKQIKKLYNPYGVLARSGKGTATYKNKWLLFDQMMCDSSKITLKNYNIDDFDYIKNNKKGKYYGYPNRTFIGNRYNKKGYSDHFPVSIKVSIK